MSASQDREAYVKAMISGDINACIRIEKKYDLFGYTPELVCIGLSAVAEGKNATREIGRYIDECITGDGKPDTEKKE